MNKKNTLLNTINMMKKNGLLIGLISILLASCSGVSSLKSTKKPKNIDNACVIAHTDESWEKIFIDTYHRYGVPPHVIMAIIHQESKYVYDAKPPRKKLLGVTLSQRQSSAYGYSQALDGTWKWYQKKTGKHDAKRTSFIDAVDFIGWYVEQASKETGVSKWDTRRQYLAYHEGIRGFQKKSYKAKPWLVKIAKKVQRRSFNYQKQLKNCR